MLIGLLSIVFLFVVFIPGISFLLLTSSRSTNIEKLLYYGLGISAAYLILSSMILLRYGLFDYYSVAILVLIPPAIALFARMKSNVGLQDVVSFDMRNSWHVIFILFVFSVIVVFTPKWNFLIAPNMDAGNYEVYSNHFWMTGNLYFQLSSYLEKNIPVEWIISRNTWPIAPDSLVSRPSYMYGYPVMLGLAKLIFNSPYVSWVVNALFSLLSAAIMTSLLYKLTRSKLVSISVSLALCLTPLFLYYSKQIMSEQIALFGYLLFCYGLLEYFRQKDIGDILAVVAGLSLVFFMKLDSFVIPTFLAMSLFIIWIDTVQNGKSFQFDKRLAWSIAAVSAASILVTLWLCNPGYLGHFSISSIKKHGYTLFLYIYAIVIFIYFGGYAFLYNRRFESIKSILTRLNASQVLSYFLIVAWLYFIGWSLAVRPVGATLAENHDALNIHRLLTVFSPLFLIMLLLALPITIKHIQNRYKIILLMGFLGLALVINKASHSPPDIWWMRRYLVVLLPTAAVFLGVLFRLIVVKKWINYKDAIVYTVAVAAISIVVQYPNFKVFAHYEVNAKAPSQIAELDSLVSNDSLLVMEESNSVVRGTINVLRSLREGPTLLNVPGDKINDAIDAYPEQREIFLVTQRLLESNEINNLEFNLIQEGMLQKQWINNLGLLLDKPGLAKSTKYYLYTATRG